MLVHFLRLSVCLRVVCATEILLYFQLGAYLFGKMESEPHISIRDDFGGEPYIREHLVFVFLCYFFHIHAFYTRQEDDALCAVVVSPALGNGFGNTHWTGVSLEPAVSYCCFVSRSCRDRRAMS